MRYFEFSAKRSFVLTNVIDSSDAKKKKLQQLCRTRWVERIASYENFWELFVQVTLNWNIVQFSYIFKYFSNGMQKTLFLLQVYEALTEIQSSRDFNPESSTAAKSLCLALGEFELIITLCIARHLMKHLKNVTIALQGVEVDVVTCYKMVQTIKDTLQAVSLIEIKVQA